MRAIHLDIHTKNENKRKTKCDPNVPPNCEETQPMGSGATYKVAGLE